MKGRHIIPFFSACFIAGNIATEWTIRHSAEPRTAAAFIGATSLLLIFILLTVTFCLKPGRRFILCFAMAFLGGCSGISAWELSTPEEKALPLKDDSTMKIDAVITGSGLTRKGRIFLEGEVCHEKTYIYGLPEDLEWKVGDTLSATVRVRAIENFSPDFDYRRYMQKKDIYHTCFVVRNKECSISPCNRPPLRLLPARQREILSEAVDSLLSRPEQAEVRAVVKALAYGYQDEVPEETVEAFRSTGAMHLLALSGMHLGMIHGLLTLILSLFGNSPVLKKMRSVVLISVLWGYTIATGCGMSILRAMVMVTVYETGILCGRKKGGLHSLATSVLLITIFNPNAPSDIGFQLSCCAMLGIFIIYPRLRNLFECNNFLLRKFRDACAMTAACQFTTAPLILLHFGTFATFSLIINLLCSPLTSVAMILTPLSFLDFGMLEFLGNVSVRLLETTVKLLIFINKVFYML